jgi:hypothetical protein
MSAINLDQLLWTKVSSNQVDNYREKWKFYEGSQESASQITSDERTTKSLEYWTSKGKTGVLIPSEFEVAIWGDLPVVGTWEQ